MDTILIFCYKFFIYEIHFNNFFLPLEKGLLVVRQWGQSGILDLTDVPALNAKFMPLLGQNSRIFQIYQFRNQRNSL